MADILGVANTLLKGVPILGPIIQGASELVPQIEDEVTVEIVGQPGASKKQLYFMALSTAFALCRRFDRAIAGRYVFPPPGMFMIEYDAADHWVRATVRYKTSILEAATVIPPGFVGAIVVAGGLATRKEFFDEAVVFSGPKCDVAGEEFKFTGAGGLLPGIPGSAKDVGAPHLPFAGKTILTPCATVKNPDPAGAGNVIPTPNPKPPGDNRSRGLVVGDGRGVSFGSGGNIDACCPGVSKLVPLVFAALTDPGSFDRETFPAPKAGPTGG